MTSTGYRPLSQSLGKPGERPATGGTALHTGERPVGQLDPIIGRRPITGGSSGHIGRRPTTSIGVPSWVLSGASLDIYPAGGLYYDGSTTTFGAIATTVRASTAYSWDSLNAFTLFPANTPRITDLGLFLENAATNKVQRNHDLTSGSWTKPNTVLVASQACPDPLNSFGNLFGDGAATAAHQCTGANVSFTSGTTYWLCTWAQKLTADRVQIQGTSAAFGVNAYANFNMNTGTVGTVGSAVTASGIINFSSALFPNLYLCYIAAPATATVSAPNMVLARITADNSVRAQSYAGTSTNIFIWLPGCYADFLPLSPVLNNANAAFVRAVDDIQITGSAATAEVYASLSAYSDTNFMKALTGANVICNINAALLQSVSSTTMQTSNGTDVATCTIGSGGTIFGDTQTSYGYDGVNLTCVANSGIPATFAAAWGATSGTIQLGNRIALDRSTQGFIRRIAFSPIASNFDGVSLLAYNIYEGDYFEMPLGDITQPAAPMSTKVIPADVVYTLLAGYDSALFTIPLLTDGEDAGASTNTLRLPAQTWASPADTDRDNVYVAPWQGVSSTTGAVTTGLRYVRVNKLVVGTVQRYIGPSALGTGDGTSAANQAVPSALNTMLAQVGPGGTVNIFADQGTYPNGAFSGTALTQGGGASTGVITIRGVNAAMAATNVPIVSNRTTFTPPPDPQTPTDVTGWTTGSAMFNMSNGANNLKFLNWAGLNGGSFIHATGSFHGLILDTHNAFNFQRYLEMDHQLNIGNVTIRDVTINGYSKQAIRFRGASHDWIWLRANCDSMRQNGDNFAVGTECSEFAHDATVTSSSFNNSYSNIGTFWNGDGFSSEHSNYNFTFTTVTCNGSTDGGLDMKAANVVVNGYTADDNRANLKLWINTFILTGITSTNPNKRGGSGVANHIDGEAGDTAVTRIFVDATSVFTDTDPTKNVTAFYAENDTTSPFAAVHFHIAPGTTISTVGTLFAVKAGAQGSTYDDFTVNPPWDIIGMNSPGIINSGDYTFTEPANSVLPAPQFPAVGDLMHATISYRDVANFTLPVGWTSCGTPETSGNTTTGGIASQMMAYCIRGSSAPSMVFTRTGGGKAEGTLRIYRKYDGTVPVLDAYSSATQASNTTTPVCPSLTTSAANALIIMGTACPRDTGVTAFSAATNPATASGAVSLWDYPYPGKVFARTNITSTGGTQVSISTFDAIRATAGATGQFSGTAGATGRQAVCVVAFK